MENVVSVENDHNENAYGKGQKTVGVLNVGWRRTDGSGTPGNCRVCD